MKQYEMPYSFLFTDEELTDLWSYYRRIHQIIRCVEDRYHLTITDMEVHCGALYRSRALLAEAQRRESLHGNALMPREMPHETITILEP